MSRRLRREIRWLQVYATTSSLVLVVLAVSAFRQAPTPQKVDELTVQRLNVIDANGTLRLVVSGKDRMHPGILDGKTIDRARPVAGLIFFNDEGDEVGGLTITGQDRDGVRRANALLAFDQIKQDQTIALAYSEANGQRSTGLTVWDRPEVRLSELIDKLNAAQKIPDAAAREMAIQAARASMPPSPRRVFVGKNTDRSAAIMLADANGKPRLNLRVDAAGQASIEFLDADGKVTERIPAR
ncbi:MAG: hypothetical protein ACRD1H_12965 [Vicinamibacterales bacterium]